MKTTRTQRNELLEKIKSGQPFHINQSVCWTARYLAARHGFRANIKRGLDGAYMCVGVPKSNDETKAE